MCIPLITILCVVIFVLIAIAYYYNLVSLICIGGGILGVYVMVGFLGFIFILVILIAIVLGLCCYWRIKNRNGTSQIATEEVRARSEDNFYADHDGKRSR